MHYGLCITNLGDYVDPRQVVRLVQAASAACTRRTTCRGST